MNNKKSHLILKEVKRAQNILLNCHRDPDADSIGSALAMYVVLNKMGKRVTIVCPSDEITESISYLKNYDKIQKNIDFTEIDFSKFDLFITMDSSSWGMVTELKDFQKPKIKTIVIDHHVTNTYYGDINLVDDKSTSVAEMIYLIFKDWKVEIDKNIANCLLAGIIGDTGAFRYPNSKQKTFRIATDLMDMGADKDMIIHHLYRSEPINLLKFYGEALRRLEIDKSGKFVWTAIPHEVLKKYDPTITSRESTASLFAQIVTDTDFGFVIIEREPRDISISFRSRTGFDTSKIAQKLGGGGHVYASGVNFKGTSIKMVVKEVLSVVRKYVKENQK